MRVEDRLLRLRKLRSRLEPKRKLSPAHDELYRRVGDQIVELECGIDDGTSAIHSSIVSFSIGRRTTSASKLIGPPEV